MPSNVKQYDYKILVLMLLIIIEVMGVGIVFPMLPQLFIAHNSPLLSDATSETLRHFYYGVSIALWPIGMFFGVPFLGEVSDKIGRKKVFLLCLSMTAFSYGCLALSVYLHSITIFFISRLFSGFFAAGYEVAQAAAADISTPETKARNMGWIICAMSIGFIVGPLITSLTAGAVQNFSANLTVPFWIAAGLSLSNAFLILWIFQETFIPAANLQPISYKKVFSSFLFVLMDTRLAYLSIICFFLVSGWMSFFTSLPLFLSAIFHLQTGTIGLCYCIVGATNMLTILLVQKAVLKFFSLKKIITYGAWLSGILFLTLSTSVSLLMFLMVLVVCLVMELLTYSSFLAFISNAVTVEEQGKTMGGSGAVSSMSFAITGIVTALLANIQVRLPMMLSGTLFVIIGIMMLKHKSSKA